MDSIKSQIECKAKTLLFNDNSIYKEYIDFFKASVEAAQKDTLLPTNWRPKMDIPKEILK